MSSSSSSTESDSKDVASGPFRSSCVAGVALLFVLSLTVVYYVSPLLPQFSYSRNVQFSAPNLDTGLDLDNVLDKGRGWSSQVMSLILPKDSVVAQTNYGRLLGHTIRELGSPVNVFLGVPYARPPLGQFRFAKPRPPSSWKGLRDASRFGSQCIQHKPNRTYTPWISDAEDMSEDCLYLNIWSPPSSGSALKSVMVWFHGGAFFSGSTDVPVYDGRTLAAFGDVIVVTVNYRLGALGFLDMRLDGASGNQGLHDQLAALVWVHENIGFFGGDRDEVTIFGQSAGAISVGLHYLSPLSQRYFKRGILESGAPTVSRLFYERESEATNKVPELARKLGCLGPKDTPGALDKEPEEVLHCLRGANVQELMVAQASIIDEVNLAFGPTSGDDFLPDLPVNLLHDEDGALGPQKEVLMGVNRNEGSFFLHFLEPSVYGAQPQNLSYDEALGLARKSFSFLPAKFAQLVFDMFLSWAKDREPETVRDALSSFIGDSSFTCPATLFAHLMDSSEASVYFYLFDHRTTRSPWAEWMGVLHFDEVPFVFGHPVRHGGLYTAEEVTLSRQMMDAWVTFAKTGSPGTVQGNSWPRYTKEEPQVMRLAPQNASVELSSPREATCSRWRLLLENS